MDQKRDQERIEVPALEALVASMEDCRHRETMREILVYRRANLATMERQQYLPIYRPSLERHVQKQREWRAALSPRRRQELLNARAWNANSRALGFFGCHERVTGAEFVQLLERQKERCALCDCDLQDAYHFDHIESLSNGGGNTIKNFQVLCIPCNMRKSNRDDYTIEKAN